MHSGLVHLIEGLSVSNSSTKLGNISENLGFRFTFQALRRLRSKTLVMKGLPVKQYQKEMGHSYRATMEHYVRFHEVEVLEHV